MLGRNMMSMSIPFFSGRRLYNIVQGKRCSIYIRPIGDRNLKNKHRLRLVNDVAENTNLTGRRYLCTTTEKKELNEDSLESELSVAVELETDPDEDYLRICLYPEDPDPYLSQLYEATTIQRIFDIIEEIDNPTLKHCSQAVSSLWDIQKLMFKLGPFFHPQNDLVNLNQLISDITSNTVFKEKILKTLVDDCDKLEAEPLAASLLCLTRMKFDVKSSESRKLVDECLNRKHSLSLPAISRISVCLRSENLYGELVQSNFMPLLYQECLAMKTDLQLRLVSICFRNSQRLLTEQIIKLYLEKAEEIIDSNIQLETITLCKHMSVLLDIKGPARLIRKAGSILTDRVPNMTLLELLSMHKFMEIPQEPWPLVKAMVLRISRIIEENPPLLRLDLLSCVAPFLKTVYQRQRIVGILNEYMDSYKEIGPIIHILYKVLKSVRFNDRKLYDNFWGKVNQLVCFETNDTRKVVKFSMEYMNFVLGLGVCYRNYKFENSLKRLLYFYLSNYLSSSLPTFVTPSDFARICSFLVAFGSSDDRIFQNSEIVERLDTLSGQLKVSDMSMLGRGIDTSLQILSNSRNASAKYYDQILQICSILQERMSDKLINDTNALSDLELISIARIHTHIKRATRESPCFGESINIINRRGIEDSRIAKDLSNCLLASGGYNDPTVLVKLANFIESSQQFVNPDVAEKFTILSFNSGFDNQKFPHIYDTCAKLVLGHINKLGILGFLQCCLGLCYYRSLSPELVHEIFSVEFIDQVDKDLQLCFNPTSNQMKVRHAFFELNRAVCIDMPDTNVPWFHKKFGEEIISVEATKESHIHQEVYQLLGDIITDSKQVVQKSTYSPYYYLLDFLIEFDAKNRPIKKPTGKSNFFSFRKVEPAKEEAKDKVAILVLPNSAFTRNVRSVKGYYRLRERHLEILGYRIVSIDPHKWNSMSMSEPSAKIDFLESQIFKPETYDNVLLNKRTDL